MLQLDYFISYISCAHQLFNDCIIDKKDDMIMVQLDGLKIQAACKEFLHIDPNPEQGWAIINSLTEVFGGSLAAESCGIFTLAHDLTHIFAEGPEIKH